MNRAEMSALTSINKIDLFKQSMKKLTTNFDLSDSEKGFLLGCAVIFSRCYEQDKRLVSYAELAYYIILKYSVLNNDYRPLYDFSVNFGYYPIAKAIAESNLLYKPNIQDLLSEIQMDTFRNTSKNYMETYEQKQMHNSILNDSSQEVSYIAPTSYGKSSIIVDHIRTFRESNHKIGIIVPTKSLLMQTYRMIRDANLGIKVLIHDEMYTTEDSFVAIFTQERALRLLQSGKTRFDILYIDEAHNIFDDDKRSILISRLIRKNMILNPIQKIVYLSPLVADSNNLSIVSEQNVSENRIKFNVKEPEMFEFRLDGTIHQYNRFVNQFYPVGNDSNESNYIINNSQDKNFIYIRSPKKIERFAKTLSEQTSRSHITPDIEKLINLLKKNVHEDFFAIDSIKKGVIYLHGKLPDIVKEYLESKFLEMPEIKYLIANTVILEGMNLPIETLFIMNTYSLSNKDLTNLIGRVNRLHQIFKPGTNQLYRLLPKIHFVNSELYNRKDSKMSSKISSLRSHVFTDEIANPMLSSFDFNALKIPSDRQDSKRKQFQEIVESENFILQNASSDFEKLKKYLVESGIKSIYSNLDDATAILNDRIADFSDLRDDWIGSRMLDKIALLFLDKHNISDFEIARLSDIKTRNFYEFHIHSSHQRSLKENINLMYDYFLRKISENDSMFYIGDAYGETVRYTDVYQGRERPVYIDLSTKGKSELINLAIVKLKMENDFVSFKLNRFIVMMYDYKLIDEDEYNTYIYGTKDKKKIAFTKFGLGGSLISRLETDKQLGNISLDEFNNLRGNAEFHAFKETIDDFYRFEISRFI